MELEIVNEDMNILKKMREWREEIEGDVEVKLKIDKGRKRVRVVRKIENEKVRMMDGKEEKVEEVIREEIDEWGIGI